MRVALLVLLVMMSGCFDDPPVQEPMLEQAVVEEVAPLVNETVAPTPRVVNITGGYGMMTYGVQSEPYGGGAWRVPPGTPWIAEVTWREAEAGSMTFTVFGDSSWAEVTGRSPLRIEFPAGEVNGTVEFDLSPDLRIASDVSYEAFASIFEEAPFDPTWSALP